MPDLFQELDSRMALPGAIRCGHNAADHDVPRVRDRFPELRPIASAPLLDSLFVAPLAFPERPYHALVKDRLLVLRGNDPMADAKASAAVLADAARVFERRREEGDAGLRLMPALPGSGNWPENARQRLELDQCPPAARIGPMDSVARTTWSNQTRL